MKRNFYPFPNPDNVEFRTGDDSAPFVRGWPENGTSYNPQSPGSTFDTWNANANTYVYYNPTFIVTRGDMNFSVAYGSVHYQDLWTPPPGWNFVVVTPLIRINSVSFPSGTADSGNEFTIKISLADATISNTLAVSSHMVTNYPSEAGWSGNTWTQEASGFGTGALNLGVGRGGGLAPSLGDAAEGANLLLRYGSPWAFKVPMVRSGITYTKFVVGASVLGGFLSGTPTTSFSARVGLMCSFF